MKIQNWHRALVEYINASIGLPFVWRDRDCVTYAVGAVEAIVGRTIERPDLTYFDRESAQAVARQYSFREWLVKNLVAYPVASGFQQPGDLLIVERDGLECCHVVFDRRAYAPVLGGIVSPLPVRMIYQEAPGLTVWRFD